jgi:hypothetical protein
MEDFGLPGAFRLTLLDAKVRSGQSRPCGNVRCWRKVDDRVSLSRGCPFSGEDRKTSARTEFFSVGPKADMSRLSNRSNEIRAQDLQASLRTRFGIRIGISVRPRGALTLASRRFEKVGREPGVLLTRGRAVTSGDGGRRDCRRMRQARNHKSRGGHPLVPRCNTAQFLH